MGEERMGLELHETIRLYILGYINEVLLLVLREKKSKYQR